MTYPVSDLNLSAPVNREITLFKLDTELGTVIIFCMEYSEGLMK